MAAISTDSLFNSFKRRFSITNNSSERFLAAFLAAYNDCLLDLYNSDLIDEPTLLTTKDTDSELGENYLPIIKQGIRYYLQTEGEWIKGDMIDQYAFLNWQRRIAEAAELTVIEDERAGNYTGPWGEE